MMHAGCRAAYSYMICRTATGQTGVGESTRKAGNDMIAWTNAKTMPRSQTAKQVELCDIASTCWQNRVSAISSPVPCSREMGAQHIPLPNAAANTFAQGMHG